MSGCRRLRRHHKERAPMTQTVLIDLGSEFAAQARKGEAAALTDIAKANALEMGLLCPKRDNCSTVYMAGANACAPDVIEQLRAVAGVTVVTPLPHRRAR